MAKKETKEGSLQAEIRIPTETYGYVSVTVHGSPAEIAEMQKELKKHINPGPGLSAKDFNAALDRYLKDNTGDTAVYLAMSKEQQQVFQEIKKSLARIASEEKTPVVESQLQKTS